jgi:DNA-binding transcriptional LysR family regulator
MTVNLKLLSVFVLVAEHSSFRKAAEELGRSQSAVSTQIRQLEEQLGVTLFHRTTRRVTLSSEGEQLLTCVRQALSEIQNGVQAIFNAVEVRRGRVVLACAPTIAGARLAPILASFKTEFPNVIVHVRELAASEMLDALQAQDVDLGIGPRVKRETDFHFRGVLQDDIWAVVPPETTLADPSGISLAELGRLPTLMITRSAALRADIERQLEDQHVVLDPQYEGMQVQTMLSLVEAGLGAAVLPRIAIPTNPQPRFRALPLRPPMSREICIITLAGKTLSPVATQFAAIAERVLRASAA